MDEPQSSTPLEASRLSTPLEASRLSAPDRRRIALNALLAVIAVFLASGVGLVAYYAGVINHSIRGLTYDAEVIPAERGERVFPFLANGAVDSLVLLTEPTPDGNRALAAVQVLHLAADRRSSALVTFPVELLTDVPGRGSANLAEAYRIGGNALLARSVEGLMGVTLDHAIVMGLSDALAMVDIVGGVTVTNPREFWVGSHRFAAGATRLTSESAAAFVGANPGATAPAPAREERAQQLVRGLLMETIHGRSLFQPAEFASLMALLGKCTTVDTGLNGLEAARIGIDLRTNTVGIELVPAPTRPVAGGSELKPALVTAESMGALTDALREDTLATYVRTHG